MAEDGFLPRAMAKRTRRTYAPWVSILVCAAAWALCLGLNFSKLVMLDVLLTGMSILLEFAAIGRAAGSRTGVDSTLSRAAVWLARRDPRSACHRWRCWFSL